MKKIYFERQLVIADHELQIWERRCGGEWEVLIRDNKFKDQYGPYAKTDRL